MKKEKLLLELGFTLYESQLLLALASSSKLTVKELSQTTKVPKNKIYESLEKLAKEGVIQIFPSKPKEYGVINLKESMNQKIEKKKEVIDSLYEDVQEFEPESLSEKTFEEKFWVMEGVDAMVHKIIENLEEVENESLGFVDVWSATYSNLQSVKKAIERGVEFYFLGRIDNHSYEIAKRYHDLGVHIRNLDISHAGYSIFDTSKIQLRVSDKKLLSLWLESPPFAKILRDHFFTLWEEAEEISFS